MCRKRRETVHLLAPMHPGSGHGFGRAFGRAAFDVRHLCFGRSHRRGLTGQARPLYSAGFATSAFRPMRDAPLWRNW
jgi:hypothetical protein